LQLFSSNFPAASLQAVLDTGNTATQNINLTGSIYTTLIKPFDIEDVLGSTGSTFQVLSKANVGINWVDLPVDNLQGVLDAGNTATQNIILFGNITSTRIIPGNIQDDTSGIGTIGQVLSKTASGIRWITNPSSFTAGLNDVLLVGNTATNDITLVGNINVIDAHISGALYDSNNSPGTSGQILSSTVTGTDWIDSPSSITPSALTKVDDTNVTLNLGGTPNTALLQGVSLTLGWTGTLADIRIASASIWNAKQDALSGTGLVKSVAGTISYITDNSINWDTAYNDRITSLTTIGTGAATLVANVLNIPTPSSATFVSLTTTGDSGSSTLVSGVLNVPTYTLAGLGGVPTNRTLTINGTAYDLSADRTWNVGTVTSIGLSMPSAFIVSSSPITGAGTIAVAGAGVASQYIRGDGTLANFPTSTGGGASVSYYLNGSISQGTIGGVAYKEMNSVPVIGTGTDFTINADGYIAQFITDVGDPNKLLIPAGNWNFETYFSASSGGGSPRFYIELYKYNGTTFTLIASNSANPEFIIGGTSIDLYFSALAVPATTLTVTDRLAVRFYVIHSGRTITMHTENSHLSQIITTFSSGLTALNGLTSQVQYFAVGTSGADFNISSATDTHTFNLPTASAINRGALSSADWTTFNSKANASGTLNFVSKFTSTGSTLGNSQIFDNGINVGIGTATPSANLDVFGTIGITTNGNAIIRRTSVVGTNGVQIQGNINNTINDTNPGASILIGGGPLNDIAEGNIVLTAYGNTGSAAKNTITFCNRSGVNTTTERMRISSNGNVGIGTNSPNVELSLFNATNPRLHLQNTLSGVSSSRGFQLALSGSDGYIWNWENGATIFATNNAERMRISATGNVGIGTTSPSALLSLQTANNYAAIFNTSTIASSNTAIGIGGYTTTLGTSGGTIRVYHNHGATTATQMAFEVNGNFEAMRIVDTGNVGIGTSSPGVRFVNSGAAFSSGPTLGSGIVGSQALLSNNGLYGMYSGVSSNGDVWHQVQRNDANATVYNLALQPSGGGIYIGTNAPVYGTSAKLQILFDGLSVFGINFKSTAVNSIPIHFTSSTGTQTGYIFQDATSVFLVSVSDYRLKEDLNSFSGLDLISKINVYDYKWKNQDKRSFGVMAHELQEVVPQAAFGEKDGERMQGVDYSTLVPILIQAIKEQQTQIEELKILINK
jgi:hypothetical protein